MAAEERKKKKQALEDQEKKRKEKLRLQKEKEQEEERLRKLAESQPQGATLTEITDEEAEKIQNEIQVQRISFVSRNIIWCYFGLTHCQYLCRVKVIIQLH